MNRTLKYFFPLLMAAVLLQTPASADGISKIAQSGMKWLSIPVGARASALGNAYTALANDASAVFWNPAGLAFAEGGHLFLNQNQWIAEINVSSAAISWSTSSYGVFGVHLSTVDWGTLNGTRRTNDAQGYEETGTFSPDHFLVGVSYARRISERFALGGNVRYLHENLGTTNIGNFDEATEFTAESNLLAFDFGTIYHTGYKDLRIAMSFQNFSKEVVYREEYFSLPLTFRIGMAMGLKDFIGGQDSPHNVTMSVDAIHPRDYGERMHLGLEYGFKDLVFLRGGYKTNYNQEDFTVGGGFAYSAGSLSLGLDYSYVAFQNFDGVHMFSFDFQF
ncbi:MAG: PorV/PorQ family protein [Calditrichaeota bacterium]|nr:PorV/PorQ family protein [Calditrichota bacterium]